MSRHGEPGSHVPEEDSESAIISGLFTARVVTRNAYASKYLLQSGARFALGKSRSEILLREGLSFPRVSGNRSVIIELINYAVVAC